MGKKTNMLIILDGLGIGREYDGNAYYLANTPVLDSIRKEYPTSELVASGEGVGLPSGQMGNSEVGHLNIGAGRIVYQNLLKINNALKDGTLKNNEVLKSSLLLAKGANRAVHFIGLLSDGGVHSHEEHLYGMLELSKELEIPEVYVHVILDGRDVSPHAGIISVRRLLDKMEELEIGSIATISGRYYAMDRDNNWERTKRAYDTIVVGKGVPVEDIEYYINESYHNKITDEFMEPRIVFGYTGMEDGDTVVFYNFRPDRARQLTRAIVDEDFQGFLREKKVNVNYVTMTEYDKTIKGVRIIFGEDIPSNTLGGYLSKKDLTQLRIAETEKYAHVTFFFNGGVERKFDGEDRILVPSPKVATFDLKPEMSAFEVGDETVKAIDSGKYDLIVLNFANCDMVGHTGIIPSAIRAVEAVDFNLGKVITKLKEKGGSALITADHGNCELMLTDDGQPITSHSTSPVPLILFNYENNVGLKSGGRLCDLSPTLLDMMDIEQPEEMTGNSLLERMI